MLTARVSFDADRILACRQVGLFARVPETSRDRRDRFLREALQVLAHPRPNLLHRLDLGAHRPSAPVLEHAAYDVDLLAIENLAQPLLQTQARAASLPLIERASAG